MKNRNSKKHTDNSMTQSLVQIITDRQYFVVPWIIGAILLTLGPLIKPEFVLGYVMFGVPLITASTIGLYYVIRKTKSKQQ